MVTWNTNKKKIKSKSKKKPSGILKISYKESIKNTLLSQTCLNLRMAKICQIKWKHFFKIMKEISSWRLSIFRRRINWRSFRDSWWKLKRIIKGKYRRSWRKWGIINMTRSRRKWKKTIRIGNLRFYLIICVLSWGFRTREISLECFRIRLEKKLSGSNEWYYFTTSHNIETNQLYW